MKNLAGLHVVVLGGGGFIGTHLCRQLQGRTSTLRAYGRRLRAPAALADVDWQHGDWADRASLAEAVAGADTVFHLISTTTPASANDDMVGDVAGNLVNTLHLLDACREAEVRRIVFVSSGGTIYGVRARLPIGEDAPTEPIGAHGITKLAIERHLALRERLDGLEHRVLRVANAFGPLQDGERGQGVIGAFLRRAAAGQPIEIWGTGEVTRDYVYVEDVADALVRAAVHEGPERIFNVGSGEERSLLEVVRALHQVLGLTPRVMHRPSRPVDVPRNVLDIRLARTALGWAPRVPFEEGLRRTAAWLGLGCA